MNIHKSSLSITKAMSHIGTFDLPISNKIEIFLFPINANEFDYNNAVEHLLESVVDFALSRKTKDYIGKSNSMKLSKRARDKFKDWKINKGELGEFLLFCFLEGHLGAPKILSKLELKTSSEMYVHGADGLHYMELEDGNFQLIFGESKLYKSLTKGLHDAFDSISKFKLSVNDKNEETSGIIFERSLMSSSLDQVSFNESEKAFLNTIIYPTQDTDSFNVDDSFGIFVGYEVDFENERKTLNNSEFRKHVESSVIKSIESQKENIKKYIDKFNLYGHSFYIYLLPFSQLDESRKLMLKELLG